ncbi:hypothetical protein [Streptomyces sp. NPDC127100]|uniref:hypothetical protein n=1 Tax=Streptomyces sp. NPDC127100 TaxID=3347138 RepID=UPI0036533B7D
MMIATVEQPTAERVTSELGPRTEGVTYYNPSGTFDVLEVLRGEEAREALGRRGADWAVRVRRRHTGEVTVHCLVWTNSDHVLVESGPATKVRTVEEIRTSLWGGPTGKLSDVDCDVLTNLAEIRAYENTRAVTTR